MKQPWKMHKPAIKQPPKQLLHTWLDLFFNESSVWKVVHMPGMVACLWRFPAANSSVLYHAFHSELAIDRDGTCTMEISHACELAQLLLWD